MFSASTENGPVTPRIVNGWDENLFHIFSARSDRIAPLYFKRYRNPNRIRGEQTTLTMRK
jgi:hypothetical protein